MPIIFPPVFPLSLSLFYTSHNDTDLGFTTDRKDYLDTHTHTHLHTLILGLGGVGEPQTEEVGSARLGVIYIAKRFPNSSRVADD